MSRAFAPMWNAVFMRDQHQVVPVAIRQLQRRIRKHVRMIAQFVNELCVEIAHLARQRFAQIGSFLSAETDNDNPLGA